MKNLIIIVFINASFAISCCTQDSNVIQPSSIQYSMSIQVELSTNSVKFGDTLIVKVRFINKKNYPIYYYPNAILYLARDGASFNYESTFLNKLPPDYSITARINSLQYKDTLYCIIVHKPLFILGENVINICYAAKKDNHTKNKENSVQFGYLNSEKFNLKVFEYN